MTKEHARDVLRLQLVMAATDGNRKDWRKKNYIEALEAGIEALTACRSIKEASWTMNFY